MKIIFTLVMCCCSYLVIAQSEKISVEPDERLYEVYEEDYLKRLQTSNPFLIQRWNFYLDNAYILSENIKNADYPAIHIEDVEKINILLLEKEQKLAHNFDTRTYYSVANTNKILIYRSGKELREALNLHLNRSKRKSKIQLQAGKIE